MKASNIEVGHIYYVQFDPVKKGEFGKQHLAVVLKKNRNRITFVVIPLTKDGVGSGKNKVALGKLDCLPKNLQSVDSYAVYDQVRTVSASRFSDLYENGKVWSAVMPRDKMVTLYRAVIEDFLHDVPESERILIIH